MRKARHIGEVMAWRDAANDNMTGSSSPFTIIPPTAPALAVECIET
jgi:hypothetical protein